jgi:hypothetical protein
MAFSSKIFEIFKQKSVKMDEIMGFALRLFSAQVSSLKKSRNILWVFSGTRPNLGLEMKVASTFWNPFEISKYLCDFNIDNVYKIIQSYFLVDGSLALFKDKLEQLCGPPKLVSFFIKSSAKFKLKSVDELLNSWDDICTGSQLRIYHFFANPHSFFLIFRCNQDYKDLFC